jgi:hypothetical protein
MTEPATKAETAPGARIEPALKSEFAEFVGRDRSLSSRCDRLAEFVLRFVASITPVSSIIGERDTSGEELGIRA